MVYSVKMSLIYSPEEDSYLLEETIKKQVPKLLKINSTIKFLEIGIGSGIQLNTAQESGIKKENIFGVDINPDAVSHCKKQGFNCFKSDLFENLKDNFDLMVFNPPYLPEDENYEDEESKLITTGGRKGSEIINEFLVQSKKHLNKNGKIFLLTSSLTKGIKWAGYKKKLLSEKKIFFESLKVWELTL